MRFITLFGRRCFRFCFQFRFKLTLSNVRQLNGVRAVSSPPPLLHSHPHRSLPPAGQDKGLDTEGSFDQWWKNNLDPETILVSIKEMKACACVLSVSQQVFSYHDILSRSKKV